MYNITLEANNTEFQSTGETLFDALGNIPLDTLSLKTKSRLHVEHNGKRAFMDFTLMKGRGLLRNHVRRQGYVYQLEALLK